MKRNQQGFTIVELLIATAVFSMVILVCSIAILQIGRTFYKGMTVTKTQEVARSVIADVSGAIEFSAGRVETINNNGGSRGFCAGNTRYSYVQSRMLPEDLSRHSFVADRLDLATPALTCSSSISALNLDNPLPPGARELLAPRMRVARVAVCTPGMPASAACPNPPVAGSSIYSVSVRIVSGDDSMLTNPGGTDANCNSLTGAGQFCAAIELSTSVQKRVQ